MRDISSSENSAIQKLSIIIIYILEHRNELQNKQKQNKKAKKQTKIAVPCVTFPVGHLYDLIGYVYM